MSLGIRATSSIGDAAGDLSCSGRKPRKQSHPRQKSGSIVTAITARSALEVTISMMRGDSLNSNHLCPSCGRPMDLTRTIAASPGYGELHTYGCRECGVWVTEGSAPTPLGVLHNVWHNPRYHPVARMKVSLS